MNKYPTSDQTETTTDPKPRHRLRIVLVVVIVIIVALGVIGYLHRPVTGKVTAVSSTSISIRPRGSSATKTYSITSSTMMGLPKSAGGGSAQKFNSKDIHTGETVVINVSPRNNQAQAVTVNP